MADPDTSPKGSLAVEFLSSLSLISAEEWNGVAGTDYPFLRHEFLLGLELSACTTADTGWQPCHAVMREGEAAVAVMPLYLKGHSYGEYVFDWAWADAWQRHGLAYYPKLVSAIPFTPATGPRLGIAPGCEHLPVAQQMLEAVTRFAKGQDLSSWHLLFPEESLAQAMVTLGLPRRTSAQFHWFNEGFASFEDFLGTFSSRKRKSLRRERRRVAEQGIHLQTLCGGEISAAHWQQFHRFYQLTYAKRSGHGGYLTEAFFTEVAPSMGEQVIMVVASLEGVAIAGALYFRSDDTLFGRYWGCEEEYDCLHFEACYYQGIEYCIRHGLKRFDPGAQGEHKIQRGFRPVETYSNHWIADDRFADAVADFTRQEATQTGRYIEQASSLLPFREEPGSA